MEAPNQNRFSAIKQRLFSQPTIELILSIVSIAYIFFALLWLSPDSGIKKAVLAPANLLLLYWRLDQNWALFSPTIRDINYHTVAIVTFEDGTKAVWEPPRMDKLSLWERFQKEKFRKLDIDSLPWPDYKKYWPDFARYVGRKLYNGRNKPLSLSLNNFWIEIPRPTKDHCVSRDQLPSHSKLNNVFYYRYSAEELK